MALCISHRDFQIVISDDTTHPDTNTPAITVTDMRAVAAADERRDIEALAASLLADVLAIVADEGRGLARVLKEAMPAGAVLSVLAREG